MDQTRHLTKPCLFGGSAAEVARVQQLGELLQRSTRRALREAGVAGGMSVLDVGCGPGSVSFLAAELVGPSGRSWGSTGTRRCWPPHAYTLWPPVVSFIEADLTELGAEGWLQPGFDAIIGWLILLHVADRVAVFRTLDYVVYGREPDLWDQEAPDGSVTRYETVCTLMRKELGWSCG